MARNMIDYGNAKRWSHLLRNGRDIELKPKLVDRKHIAGCNGRCEIVSSPATPALGEAFSVTFSGFFFPISEDSLFSFNIDMWHIRLKHMA